MDDSTIARALHGLAMLMWIGGVAFVTTVVMPSIRRTSAPGERAHDFYRFEDRFARQARFWVLLAGSTGFWMVYRADIRGIFCPAEYLRYGRSQRP